MALNSFAPFPKINGCFIVNNNSNPAKTLFIFNYPIPYGASRDLLAIPGVSESDIRASLLKGELQHKIRVGDISIICSDIDLLQFNAAHKSFLQSAGIINGLAVAGAGGVGTGGFDIQDSPIIGLQDGFNTTFTTPTKFIHTTNHKEVIFTNGLRNHIPEDYFVAESGGPGTGYDTIVFTIAPMVADVITIDYFEAP
jgi:hypothetical protein